MELRGIGQHRGRVVHGRLRCRQAEIALRVDGVVVAEVRDRRYGNTRAKPVGMGKCIQRKRAAPAPTPPAQPAAIQLRVAAQHLVARRQLVGKRHPAEIAGGRLLKGAPTPAHASVVHVQHRKAVLGQQLVKVKVLAAPAILHGRTAGAAVRVGNERDARGRARVLGHQQRGIHGGGAVGRLKRQDFRRMHGAPGRHLLLPQIHACGSGRAVDRAQIESRRVSQVGVGIGKAGVPVGKSRFVHPGARGELVLARAVQLHRPHLLPVRLPLGAGVVDGAATLAAGHHRQDVQHLIRTALDCSGQGQSMAHGGRGVIGIVLHVHVARAPRAQ